MITLHASTSKERFIELQKNPLFFCEYREKSYDKNSGSWYSMDSSISIDYCNEAPEDSKNTKLFIVRSQTVISDNIEAKKQNNDTIKFEISEFKPSNSSDWEIVFNDCLYNYNSRNYRHCHMILFWALQNMTWDYTILQKAYSNISQEAAQVVCSHISSNMFAFSINKQNLFINLLKNTNPNIQHKNIDDVEAALVELSPSNNFDDFGFYDKIDYILGFGSTQEEDAHLKILYTTSKNRLIHYKYWIDNCGHKFFNYNYLETIYSYIDPNNQLSLVKRYLHDVRLQIITPDFSLLQKFKDVRYQNFVDIRYFFSNPGRNIDMIAPMFCDSLLTLKNSNGAHLQEFNGILDFAVTHSNKSFPNIDLGVTRFIPICDGGLVLNSSFLGFIQFSIYYKLDESKLTDENLKSTKDFLLSNYASLLKKPVCSSMDYNDLSTEDFSKCSELSKSMDSSSKKINKSSCVSLTYIPIEPNIWKKKEKSDSYLGIMIDKIESKQYIKDDDINFDKLKTLLLRWGKRYTSYTYYNGMFPAYLNGHIFASHIVRTYYSPYTMRIYPNKNMYYSSERSMIGAWDDSIPHSDDDKKNIAFRNEAPLVYDKTFNSLKQRFPDALIGADYLEIPYNKSELDEIKAYYHYKNHTFSSDNTKPDKRYNEFLSCGKVYGPFYCTPKVSDRNDIVSGLPFYWCKSKECYYNVLGEQTLDKQPDWKKYTLYHAAEILGFKLIEVTDKGNIPAKCISDFAAEVRQVESKYSRLVCRGCGHMIFSVKGSLLLNTKPIISPYSAK